MRALWGQTLGSFLASAYILTSYYGKYKFLEFIQPIKKPLKNRWRNFTKKLNVGTVGKSPTPPPSAQNSDNGLHVSVGACSCRRKEGGRRE